MTVISEQIARDVDVRYYSIARRAPSHLSPSQLPYAGHRESRRCTLPKSPCSSAPTGSLVGSHSKASGTWPLNDRRSRRPRPAASADTARSRSTASASFSEQMTTIRRARASWTQGRADRASRAFPSAAGPRSTFFEPTRHGVARHAERSLETAKAASLLIGPKDRLAFGLGVSIRLWVINTAPTARVAQIALFAARGFPEPNDRVTPAMPTQDCLRWVRL